MPFSTGRWGTPDEARAYRDKFARTLVRRGSSRRELALVAKALSRTGPHRSILDCPCGAGRLFPAVRATGAMAVLADVSRAMVVEARAGCTLSGGRAPPGLVADAWRLPFAEGAFDAVVCHRLIHHVRDPEKRRALLTELRRVARRTVVLSFADATTLKSRLQGLRRRRKRSRTPLTPEVLRATARAAGLELDAPILRVSRIFSTVAVATFRVVPLSAPPQRM